MSLSGPEKKLFMLFEAFAHKQPDQIIALPQSGSYRQYFRIKYGNESCIGAYNEDKAENIAFISFTKHFLSKKLPVPQILAEDLNNDVYLLEDLGDTMLLDDLQDLGFPNEVSKSAIDLYKKVLQQLPRFQIRGSEGLDYSVCYPRSAFDRQSMMWDLNYFKYYFLKLAKVPFNEQNLENDFNTLVDYLLTAESNYFLYRDFQSRNIMLVKNTPFFIDYQGGRKGPLHYDVASILFEAKTHVPPNVREELLDYYMDELARYIPVNKQAFMYHFYGFSYIRLMQAMGAYGFRGLYEKKELFLQSIPPALNNLEWMLENVKLPVQLPELTKVWEYLVESEYIRHLAKKHLELTVTVNSFSYRRGIPSDESANGGGFVFDCRSIHNPGRYDKYKQLTGLDKPVQDFFNAENEMKDFLEHVNGLVDNSVERYQQRGFTSLMVSFGCTGGQHRSVFAAETLYQRLNKQLKDKGVVVKLRHRELEMKNSSLITN